MRAARCAAAALESGLVEVRLRHQDQALDGDEHLQETRRLCVPLLLGTAVPGVQHGQTHLAVVVQVRIEADRPSAGRLKVDHHRRIRVVGGKVDVELETAVGVRRVGRSGDQYLHDVQPIVVAPDEHRAAVGQRQAGGQCDALLGESFHAGGQTAVAGRPDYALEVVGDDESVTGFRLGNHFVGVCNYRMKV